MVKKDKENLTLLTIRITSLRSNNTIDGMFQKIAEFFRFDGIFTASESFKHLISFQFQKQILHNHLLSAVKALHGILMYQPAFKDYLYGALQEMYNDKIQHVQVRLFKVSYEITQRVLHLNFKRYTVGLSS